MAVLFSTGRGAPGPALLVGASVLGFGVVAALLWLAVEAPTAAVALPALVILGVAVAAWPPVRHPLAPLAAALGLAGLALARTEGVSPIQVVFAAYYFSYLAAWYGLRLFVYRERLVRHLGEGALVFLVLYAAGSLVLTFIYGGNLFLGIREWVALSMLALYFPIREACERYRSGRILIGIALLVLGVLTFGRNALALQATFASAEYAWEVARARATANEKMLLAAALVAFATGATARRPTHALLGAFGFAVFTAGIIVTQWRAYYVSLALGALVIGLLLRRDEQVRAGVMVALSAAAVWVGAYLVLGDLLLLVVYGLLDRVLSITTATSTDISLINRFLESRSAWELIRLNPILGHGLGTEFGFYDITTGTTWVKTYLHNGYLNFWYRLGLLGLGALLIAWGFGVRDALRARTSPSHSTRIGALFASALLLCTIPSFGVSAPLMTGDTVLIFAIALGVAGAREVPLGDRQRSPTHCTPGTPAQTPRS